MTRVDIIIKVLIEIKLHGRNSQNFLGKFVRFL